MNRLRIVSPSPVLGRGAGRMEPSGHRVRSAPLGWGGEGSRRAILAAILLPLLIAGCLSEKKDTGSAAPTDEKRRTALRTTHLVGFAQANSQDPWRQVQNA